MNHNTLPVGEDIPKPRDAEANEPLTYEEHMQAREHNTTELSKPSLKNDGIELRDGAMYLDEATESLARKVKNGEKLDVSDVTDFIDYRFGNGFTEDITRYLTETGPGINFEDGKDFDVKLPGFLIDVDGTREQTPFSVSYDDGIHFKRIDFYRDLDSHEMTVVTTTGEGNEGMDVGYQGPVSKDYKPWHKETRTFKDSRYKNAEN